VRKSTTSASLVESALLPPIMLCLTTHQPATSAESNCSNRTWALGKPGSSLKVGKSEVGSPENIHQTEIR